MSAHERLYRLMDCDEPDLGANITFEVGRVLLHRIATADPWPIDDHRAAALLAAVQRAEELSDQRAADAHFTWFVEEVPFSCWTDAVQPGPRARA